MPRAQRTINPLHFEDLEPHRFEDLVRQLAYDYRPWLYLDATGKQGRDAGVDITGIEQPASRSRRSTDDELAEPDEDNRLTGDERRWLISCKRYKAIGPTEMRGIVAETLKEGDDPPYGFVLAAACDVSAETMAAFREEAFARGVTEAHLWTKAHLEDLLFQPGNDHLLFAYFDISLGAKRQSRLGQVRSQLATKRKLMRAFSISAIDEPLTGKFALIRDIADDAYPVREDVTGFDDNACPPWHPVAIEEIAASGLVVERYRYDGWVKDDGTWDILPGSRQLPYLFDPGYWFDHDLYTTQAELQIDTIGEVPEAEQRSIRVLSLIPFEAVLEVDPIGDADNTGIHLYCRFDSDLGPYHLLRSGYTEHYVASRYDVSGESVLDHEKRRPLYRCNRELGDSSDS